MLGFASQLVRGYFMLFQPYHSLSIHICIYTKGMPQFCRDYELVLAAYILAHWDAHPRITIRFFFLGSHTKNLWMLLNHIHHIPIFGAKTLAGYIQRPLGSVLTHTKWSPIVRSLGFSWLEQLVLNSNIIRVYGCLWYLYIPFNSLTRWTSYVFFRASTNL